MFVQRVFLVVVRHVQKGVIRLAMDATPDVMDAKVVAKSQRQCKRVKSEEGNSFL